MSDNVNVNVVDFSPSTSESPAMSQEDKIKTLSPVQQQVVTQTLGEHEYTLSSGRVITFRKPSGAIDFEIAKMLGTDSLNPALTTYYSAIMSIVKIDGNPVPVPRTSLHVEATVQRLGDDFAETIHKFGEWQAKLMEELEAKKSSNPTTM